MNNSDDFKPSPIKLQKSALASSRPNPREATEVTSIDDRNSQRLAERQATEINFWRDDPLERPESDALENILSKCAEARVFLEKLKAHHNYFSSAQDVLELGAGQCWASSIVKQRFPTVRITATDISPFAILSSAKWERIFDVTLDRTLACPSYDTPFENCSFDLIFCFSAAHHFVKHRQTLREITRLLRPGGIALYLQEPASRAYLHKIAVARVTAKRPQVPEDVLVYPQLQKLAVANGLTVATLFSPTLTNRNVLEAIYYLFLRKVTFLQDVLPCTIDMIFRKLS